MAFEVSKTGYQQIDPTFLPGAPYEEKYHNVGQLMTPYQGKKFGKEGDYGPVQSTVYYTPQNPTYPYVMDSDFRPVGYYPTNACCFGHPGYSPCYQDRYPDRFTPPNYFAGRWNLPVGHAQVTDRLRGGTVKAYEDIPSKENYTNGDMWNYQKLLTFNKPLINNKNYYF